MNRNQLNEVHYLSDEYDNIIPNAKLFHRLQEAEKEIDEQIYKARLDLQELLIMPTPKVKGLLRTHIFAYVLKEEPNSWVMRIQGKVMPLLELQPGGTFQKFTHFFQKIVIKFNSDQYQDIEWKRSATDSDGFEIKRPFDIDKCTPIQMKIYFHLNYPAQEFKLSEPLAMILGFSQESRPRILYHMWQYIKINSLQDKDNPNLIILNKHLQKIFNSDKTYIVSLTSKLVEHIKQPDPIVLDFTITLSEDCDSNQILHDIIVTAEDPHFADILSFLSNSESDSLLFPKSFIPVNKDTLNASQSSFVEEFNKKSLKCDKMITLMLEILKKHKYQYDYYDAYAKDPIKFINNFIIQQNALIKMVDDSSITESRLDYTSSQYYKDNEEVIREYVDNYLAKLIPSNDSKDKDIEMK